LVIDRVGNPRPVKLSIMKVATPKSLSMRTQSFSMPDMPLDPCIKITAGVEPVPCQDTQHTEGTGDLRQELFIAQGH
jgi:hypothetical protein